MVTGWIHSAMWNNASHLAMIMFFVANTLFELGFFYKVGLTTYESFSDVGESRVWWKADFQSGSKVLKTVF